MCGAKTRAGGTCRKWLAPGAVRCRNHGGAIPRALAAQERRVADGERRAALTEWSTTFGDIGPQQDPAVVMTNLIRQASGHVSWLLERVRETEAEALVWGLSTEVHAGSGQFPGVDATYSSEINGWVRLYGEERDRLVRMCAVASRMGVDERLVTIAEVQTSLMFKALNRVFELLKLTPEQAKKAPALMAGVLREMNQEKEQAS